MGLSPAPLLAFFCDKSCDWGTDMLTQTVLVAPAPVSPEVPRQLRALLGVHTTFRAAPCL